eukprot:comp22287_c0_seq1/m.53267 comp22287_c0_seq1/g.53267  ORF comp22287_c0_seq1/g.53267 comp22287_c0_seq1/m.53267 type:complete len:338 (-) comp22287_c0_seq1:54-1067(-)
MIWTRNRELMLRKNRELRVNHKTKIIEERNGVEASLPRGLGNRRAGCGDDQSVTSSERTGDRDTRVARERAAEGDDRFVVGDVDKGRCHRQWRAGAEHRAANAVHVDPVVAVDRKCGQRTNRDTRCCGAHAGHRCRRQERLHRGSKGVAGSKQTSKRRDKGARDRRIGAKQIAPCVAREHNIKCRPSVDDRGLGKRRSKSDGPTHTQRCRSGDRRACRIRLHNTCRRASVAVHKISIIARFGEVSEPVTAHTGNDIHCDHRGIEKRNGVLHLHGKGVRRRARRAERARGQHCKRTRVVDRKGRAGVARKNREGHNTEASVQSVWIGINQVGHKCTSD